MSGIRFQCFPRTEPPRELVRPIVELFRKHEMKVGTVLLGKGLISNDVLAILRKDLGGLGFEVERGKTTAEKLQRPVFFGENGEPTLRYEIDAYHPQWQCGLEVEAGRALLGNAVYRDIVQACVMVDLQHLVLAVPNVYRNKSAGKTVTSSPYRSTVAIVETLYGHSRLRMPYTLTVIGY